MNNSEITVWFEVLHPLLLLLGLSPKVIHSYVQCVIEIPRHHEQRILVHSWFKDVLRSLMSLIHGRLRPFWRGYAPRCAITVLLGSSMSDRHIMPYSMHSWISSTGSRKFAIELRELLISAQCLCSALAICSLGPNSPIFHVVRSLCHSALIHELLSKFINVWHLSWTPPHSLFALY